jgi:hypothetical protein
MDAEVHDVWYQNTWENICTEEELSKPTVYDITRGGGDHFDSAVTFLISLRDAPS